MSSEQYQAARTLASIERWSRRTFVASVVTAVFAGLLALGAALVGWDYVKLKWAAQDAADHFAKDVATLRDGVAKPRPVTTSRSGTRRIPGGS